MLCSLGNLLRGLHPHVHQNTRNIVLHAVQQLSEQHESFALVFLFGLLLGVTPQVDALAQVVQGRQMFAPLAVDGLQQHHPLELGEVLFTHHLDLAVEDLFGSGQHTFHNIVNVDGLGV